MHALALALLLSADPQRSRAQDEAEAAVAVAIAALSLREKEKASPFAPENETKPKQAQRKSPPARKAAPPPVPFVPALSTERATYAQSVGSGSLRRQGRGHTQAAISMRIMDTYGGTGIVRCRT